MAPASTPVSHLSECENNREYRNLCTVTSNHCCMDTAAFRHPATAATARVARQAEFSLTTTATDACYATDRTYSFCEGLRATTIYPILLNSGSATRFPIPIVSANNVSTKGIPTTSAIEPPRQTHVGPKALCRTYHVRLGRNFVYRPYDPPLSHSPQDLSSYRINSAIENRISHVV